ncbi:MAG: site-2 protease family protein [Myxococcaceae bacterium]
MNETNQSDTAAAPSAAVELEARPLGEPADTTTATVEPAATAPVESEEVRALREGLRKHEQPGGLGARTLLFLGSLAAFVYVMRDSGPLTIAIIVGVLLFHEAGHFVAMKALGYENMRVFFVPFLGAAVSGRAATPGGWRSGVVSLAGPVPGIVVAALLFALAPQVPLVRATVLALVVINGLNLLPFAPLDGGRLMGTVLFSRHRLLEMAGTVIGAIGLVATPDLLPGSPALWTGLVVGLLINRAKHIEAVHALRSKNLMLEGKTSELPEASLVALRAQSVMINTNSLSRGARPAQVAALHEAAATKPAAIGHSVALFLVWAAAIGLGWSTQRELKSPKPSWRVVTGPDGRWSAEFPFEPTMTTNPPTNPRLSAVIQFTSLSNLGEFTVMSLEYIDVEPTLDEAKQLGELGMKAAKLTVTSEKEITHQGVPALEVVAKTNEGRPGTFLSIPLGNSLHMLALSASDEHVRHFREHFRLNVSEAP